MSIFSKVRKNYKKRLLHEIHEQSDKVVSVACVNKELYITYNGSPIILVDNDWTAENILLKMEEIKQNYVNTKCFELKVYEQPDNYELQ